MDRSRIGEPTGLPRRTGRLACLRRATAFLSARASVLANHARRAMGWLNLLLSPPSESKAFDVSLDTYKS